MIIVDFENKFSSIKKFLGVFDNEWVYKTVMRLVNRYIAKSAGKIVHLQFENILCVGM